MYKSLHLEKISQTLTTLEARIQERFHDCGLLQVCIALRGITDQTAQRIEWILKPNRWLRLGVWTLLCAIVFTSIWGLSHIQLQKNTPNLAEFVQLTEAFTNELVLIGASVFFLITLETRLKRARTLKALHELRAIAHVVDMHQLTKDPITSYQVSHPTPSSPKRELNAFELRRYLDYCAELLSLIGKTAALYSQKMPDPAIVTAANEVEALCASFSHKIWQKIMIIHADQSQQEH